MGDRWLAFEVEPEPVPPRRSVVRVPVPPPQRHRAASAVIGALLVAGTLTGLVGAWLAATSNLDWNVTVRESAVVRDDLALRSHLAASALTDEFAELEATVATLGEVSTALDTAITVAEDLEQVAAAGPPSDAAGVSRLVDSIYRLAGALDDAFPRLAEVGLAGPTGPGGALRAAGDALTRVPDAPSSSTTATGFGPFTLQHPVPGSPVTDSFGTSRGESVHNGVDFGAPSGTGILAAADGIVERAGWLDEGAGNGVILRHGGGWETRYFHMSSSSVSVGDEVTAGDVIGLVGSTGLSTGPHLHFEIVFGPVRLDPQGPTFTYTSTAATGGTNGDGGEDRDVATDATEPPATGGPTSEIAALSDVLIRIADVQAELREIAVDASADAAWLQARSFEQQDRARGGALLLYVGTLAVALGLLVMWATRPQWPPAR